MLNRYEYNNQMISIIDRGHIAKSINYVGRGPQEIESEGEAEIKENTKGEKAFIEYVEKTPEVIGISSIHTLGIVKNGVDINAEDINAEDLYRLTTYDPLSAEKIKLPLKKGVWFTDAKVEDGIIPVVVVDTSKFSNTYKLGQKISGKMLQAEEEKNKENANTHKNYEFQVVGIVDKYHANVYYPSGWRNCVLGYDALFQQPIEDTQVFLCENLKEYPKVNPDDDNYMVYIEEKTSDERVAEIKNQILEYGYCNQVSDMKQETNSTINYKIKVDLPNFLSMLSISMIGIISISLLNVVKQRKNFSIYQLCGCNKKRTFTIYNLYFIILLMLSFIIYIGYMIYSYLTDTGELLYLYRVTAYNLVVSGLICLGICLISTLVPFWIMRKSTIMNNYNLN